MSKLESDKEICSDTILTLAVRIYKSVQNCAWSGSKIVGEILISPENRRLLLIGEHEGLIFPSEDFETVREGSICNIELNVPQDPSGYYFAQSLDSLLSCARCQFESPKFGYIADIDVEFSKDTLNSIGLLSAYWNALEFIKLLRLAADYEYIDIDCLRLVFFTEEKLEFAVSYGYENINKFSISNEFVSDFFEDIHKNTKIQIFKRVILDELRLVSFGERFARLLCRVEQIVEIYNQSYALFISEFSYKKILDEISEKKLDYINKLSKVISDIQNQLLAIPATLIVVGSQIEYRGYVAFKNVMVLVGAMVFLVITFIMLLNQNDNITAISLELNGQIEILGRKHKVLLSDFNKLFSDVFARMGRQKNLLLVLRIIVVLSFCVTIFVFCWYSDLPHGAWNWLNRLVLSVRGIR